MSSVVTFDAGMTLVELDMDFLSSRLAERGQIVPAADLRARAGAAWRHYDERADAGQHDRLWHGLLADIIGNDREVEWLWSQQPSRNLFRAPITDMVDLARELKARGVRTAVLSNSEGRLAELLAEIGIADAFEVIVDSGRIGIEKPDPRIFEYVLAQLGEREAIHIGDSWSADVAGALAVGWRAIWYGRRAVAIDYPRVASVKNAEETRRALTRFGI